MTDPPIDNNAKPATAGNAAIDNNAAAAIDKPRADAGHYCTVCGIDLGQLFAAQRRAGCFPMHCDSLPRDGDPLTPYCGHCGKTVRAGFIARLTCQCAESRLG